MELLILAVKAFIVLHVALGLGSVCTWIERKGSALIQDRIGANRAGAYWYPQNPLLWPIAPFVRLAGMLGIINTLLNDAVKALLKEDFVPEGTSVFMHAIGPFMAVLPVFLAYSVVPLAPDFTVFGYPIQAQLVRIDTGLLFILAMGSLAVYGVVFAGWTGNNKFSLLGALRASAQMISYELAMGIVFVTLILGYGTLDLYAIVEAQKAGWGINPMAHPTGWLSFIILFIVGMAETKRGPFDMPESESELVAGYFTEYSGMKFLLFWLGEFAEIALFSLILTLFFFGGWHIPFVELPEGVWWAALVGHLVLMAKVLFFCVLQIVIRWSLPRFRYDQLMALGWKGLLPLSLLNVMVTAAIEVW
ncbi:MAG: NADH-quinone oxidoreductase subunit H [Bdellovibrionales bacterium]|nr:NADH-quinone oxidoreductase subunit H [Bdellovibrionales bacterium]